MASSSSRGGFVILLGIAYAFEVELAVAIHAVSMHGNLARESFSLFGFTFQVSFFVCSLALEACLASLYQPDFSNVYSCIVCLLRRECGG
ncbi:hypothetical protein PanWU01x14_265750 [Parasponia andersonii]|uniref:Uncharacterized protein n=1 Tax=Parasponia andersonii TaxID=3476 RepID=A0A2P5B707_PARAD|nr:hypothetical protein PanWU01x14_265750 [Parasponia andersonii]